VPTPKKQFTTIDEYIKAFPEDVQRILEKIRQTVRKAAPEATETISYGMPTFNLNDTYLVYFAAYKNHIGFYPLPLGNKALKELAPYQGAKGAVRFPLDKPIPYDLVKKIVAFRLNERQEKKK
jgi:uncharacterized protein YdhG (YjbR/CyaY superfamily)